MLEAITKKPMVTAAIVIGGGIVLYMIFAKGSNGTTVIAGGGGMPAEIIAMQLQANTALQMTALEGNISLAHKQADVALLQNMGMLQANLAALSMEHESYGMQVQSRTALDLANIERIMFGQAQQTEQKRIAEEAKTERQRNVFGLIGSVIGGIFGIL